MRVIAGRLGGRTFDSPHSFKTHPMSDKIRGALFNILGDIEGLTVLDAFAGSGALSFEAISRGAASSVAIDNDKAAQRAIATNNKQLGTEKQVKLVRASAQAWLQTNPEARFDLVLCDPPYNDLQLNLLQSLTTCLKPEGILVISWPGNTGPPQFEDVEKVAHRVYGDAQLWFFKKSATV
jgi:16S rRNA (guanine966-N2)-methyltransferase